MKTLKLFVAIGLITNCFIESKLNAQESYECEGIKMIPQGPKISTFTDPKDGHSREVYATIDKDTIYYTNIRKQPDGKIYWLKKWHVYIGLLNMNSSVAGVFEIAMGSQKIYNVAMPIVSGQSYYYEEVLCTSTKKLNKVSSSNQFSVLFDKQDEGKAFFEKVKAIKSS
ncbi:MAG: hypothetical protein ACKOA9_08105, partial [Actinomycetota bacterium]